ncbi:ABC transporter permease [Profundibacterium mesophilum]|uniref:ABC spermidineputrescine transporter inner membrane subunit n=1 Tax=Profundibacterium mesophilum KAUST100406-0324 TaxID=1037889 RepID=A0A921TCR9_9RHOB|nr:ABC transporter permease [Profundibacterium mesophilum]KAF0675237.1 ABC spermidineputrescine transporter inner membrane subunit [Profundibacterium mesophilum KAUST100406-0324]
MSGLRLYALVYLAFLYAPIALLPIFAFNDGTVIAFPLDGFTLRWFRELPQTPALVASVRTSLWIAGSTALLSTVLGLCAARAGTMARFGGRDAMMGLIMLPLVLPEIIVAVALLVVLLALGLPLTGWTVIAGHTLICLPFSTAILGSAFRALDPALEEAGIDLGLGRAAVFLRVTLPLLMPGIIASLLITFTISLDEFIIAFFLTGTEPTLPVYLWGQLRFPQKIPVVMALGTILLVISVVLITLAEIARRRAAARATGIDSGA